MAEVAVDSLLEGPGEFLGADMSTKLKLLGVDVGSIGDAHGSTPGSRSFQFIDEDVNEAVATSYRFIREHLPAAQLP